MLKDIESDQVERTRAAKDEDKIGQAICAFANDLPGHRKPGYLFIGANDDGTPSHAAVEDRLSRPWRRSVRTAMSSLSPS
ncbi:AlbA family DNA-binding domain-containing protein [Sorangium sp. So ce1182]|uniref:AlbA family DNA-binding domain-containing protein n=1 Tax=Sorangium sp. So ce1182 TaxID=3133334 RepID=UPI003F5ED735